MKPRISEYSELGGFTVGNFFYGNSNDWNTMHSYKTLRKRQYDQTRKCTFKAENIAKLFLVQFFDIKTVKK